MDNNFSIIVYRRIEALKKQWKYLCNSEKAYLSYEFIKGIQKVQRIRNLNFFNRAKQSYIRFISVLYNNKCVFVIPFLVNDYQRVINSIGNLFSVGYNDCLFAPETDVFRCIDIVLDFLTKRYGGYIINLTDICEDSALNCCFKSSKYENQIKCGERECYMIPSFKDYNVWFSSLSKSARQNLRTSYNRLSTDGKSYKYVETDNVSTGETKELYSLYMKRLSMITGADYDESTSFKNSITRYYHMQQNLFFSFAGPKVNKKYHILYIDGKIAAFFISYHEKGGVVVPKLAIDIAFGKYSPGGIIIAEYIKEHPHSFVDLSRGDEKYKRTYGGIVHLNYNYTIKL